MITGTRRAFNTALADSIITDGTDPQLMPPSNFFSRFVRLITGNQQRYEFIAESSECLLRCDYHSGLFWKNDKIVYALYEVSLVIRHSVCGPKAASIFTDYSKEPLKFCFCRH